MRHIHIYCDGGCSPNPGPGGWGAILVCRDLDMHRELSGADPETTNNRMELTAVLEALRALKQPCRVTVTVDSQRQFTREAGLLHQLRHLNLPRVTDHFAIAGQGQYLVMDYIEGEDLRCLVARKGPIAEAQALSWIDQVLDALEYLHRCQVIHRDVKPANVKITPQGQVFLVDFGLAKVYDPGQETTIGARGATPGYAPPEQYGQGRTDARSDVYSTGAMLYTLLTGKVPPDALDMVIRRGSLPSLRSVPGRRRVPARGSTPHAPPDPAMRRQLRPTVPGRSRVLRGPGGEMVCSPLEDDEFHSAENVRILESWNVPDDPALSIARARLEPGQATDDRGPQGRVLGHQFLEPR